MGFPSCRATRWLRAGWSKTAAAMVAAASATVPATAWAQKTSGAEKGGGSWAMSYALVILGIALGLMIVLNPSRRRDRPQVDLFEKQEKQLDK